MAKVQRNGPCPCGSNKKAKRCCHGPVKYIDVRVMPLDVAQAAVDVLRHTSRIEIRAAFNELAHLPELDLSLRVSLPPIITPGVAQAISALDDGDGEELDRVLKPVVVSLDTVDRRIALAHAVVALRDQGRLSDILAAIAIMDLDRQESILFTSAVAQSLGLLAGGQRTPSGLMVAVR